MTDTPEVPEGLRPANENPWYVLMTLYGEQKGEGGDLELREKNRRAWNAWSGQVLSAEDREAAAKSSEIDVAELNAWEELSEEIEARFLEEYQRRNPEAVVIHDVPDPKDLIEMSWTSFSGPVELDQAVFASLASFEFSTFTRDASFGAATFMQEAMFELTKFRQLTYFNAVTFMETASFNAATFEQYTSFNFAKFMQSASFNSATFTQSVSFDFTMFVQDAWFDTVTFAKGVGFANANFSDFVYFTRTRFEGTNEELSIPDFTNCQFDKPTSFCQARFVYGYPYFQGAILHDKTSFTARMAPTSDEITEDSTLEGQTYWPKTTKQDPISARESCATIRHVLTKQGLPEEAHFFFRREMHFAGLPSEGRSFAERLPYILFGWFSDYGYSIQRPLVWLLCLWAFGSAAFWGYLAGCCTPAPLEAVEHPMGTAMALSFSNLFPLFGFGRAFLGDVLEGLPPVLKTLLGTQTVLSLPLLFFLGLGLRQRFRLR